MVNCYLQWERKVLCFRNAGKVTVMLHEKNQGVAVPLGQITAIECTQESMVVHITS